MSHSHPVTPQYRWSGERPDGAVVLPMLFLPAASQNFSVSQGVRCLRHYCWRRHRSYQSCPGHAIQPSDMITHCSADSGELAASDDFAIALDNQGIDRRPLAFASKGLSAAFVSEPGHARARLSVDVSEVAGNNDAAITSAQRSTLLRRRLAEQRHRLFRALDRAGQCKCAWFPRSERSYRPPRLFRCLGQQSR